MRVAGDGHADPSIALPDGIKFNVSIATLEALDSPSLDSCEALLPLAARHPLLYQIPALKRLGNPSAKQQVLLPRAW